MQSVWCSAMVFQIGLGCGAERRRRARGVVSVFLAEFLKKSSEKLVPVFRNGNPCVRVFDDISQGPEGGVHSLWFSVGAWCAFCVRS